MGVGLSEEDAGTILPASPSFKKGEHISAFFEAPPAGSWLKGIGPADIHCRDPREIPLLTGGAKAVGDGVLGILQPDKQVIFFQLVPWQFHELSHPNVKKTFRRSSFRAIRSAGPRA